MMAAALLAGAAAAQFDQGGGPGAGLSPDRLKKILAEAMARRMAMERDQVAVEIREGMLFIPDQVDPAIRLLNHRPANQWEDNAHRICKAFAMVDLRFGKAWAAMVERRFGDAASIVKGQISERDTSYLAAAKQFCHAEALTGQGRYQDAADAYAELVRRMPDRFSFAAMALLRAAECYETLHRNYSAMSLYRAWVDSFGLLDTDLAAKLTAKADRIAADYKDPMGTLVKKMGEAHSRLAQIDSGRQTQRKQQEVIEMLDDLIAMAEEQPQRSSQSRKKQQGQGQCKSCGGKGCGQCGGGGQGQGSKSGPAGGIGVPSSHAMASRLVGGSSPRPAGLAEIRPSGPGDDWGRLPPRDRRKLLETFREDMPERYRNMLEDYYRKLAAERAR
jgi:tetratricopeptide (TPR) repeat protein